MEPVVIVLLILVTLIGVGSIWLMSAAVVGSIARAMYRKGKGPWAHFDEDAERLHRLTHPAEPPDADKG